jgi:hypothetical protein
MASSKLPGDKLPNGYRAGQLQQFTPEAMQLYKQSFAHVSPDSFLGKLAAGDPRMFEQMEAPAFRQFNQLQGQMASRFSGMGGMGGRRSSGFQNEMTAAGSNFAQDLQARRMELQNQAIRDLMGMSHTLMNEKPFERFMYEKPQKQGFNWGGAAGALAGGVGGFFLGGPMGAMSGAQMGYGVGSGFSGHSGGGVGGGGWQSTPGWKPSWTGLGSQSGYNAAPGLEDAFRTGAAYQPGFM